MRRLRKQPVAGYSPWNMNHEGGDRVYVTIPGLDDAYHMYDLLESRGRDMRDAGELTFRVVKKNGKSRLAVKGDNGIWYWKDT